MEQKYDKKIEKANKKKRKKTFRPKRYVKRGICRVTGKQKWYDKKEKKYFFKKYKERGYGEEVCKMAIKMSQEGIGYRTIGRLLNVSHVTVYNWINTFKKCLDKPELPEVCSAIEFDEMWHFCQKKR